MSLEANRLSLPWQVLNFSLVLAVIGNLPARTGRTSRHCLPSHANDDLGLSLLHTFQHQSVRCRQGIPDNIGKLAHDFKIANLSSLHRKCGRTDFSAARHLELNPHRPPRFIEPIEMLYACAAKNDDALSKLRRRRKKRTPLRDKAMKVQ
jgi:hypothetical protein